MTMVWQVFGDLYGAKKVIGVDGFPNDPDGAKAHVERVVPGFKAEKVQAHPGGIIAAKRIMDAAQKESIKATPKEDLQIIGPLSPEFAKHFKSTP